MITFSPVILIVSYFIGSIPFGLILTKMAGLGDVRDIGSGNVGATNVLRTGNKKLAALTLLLDALKGAAAVLVFTFFLKASTEFALLAGLFAMLGHCFPVWLKFKGGKGVATGAGVLLAAVPFVGLVACVVWILSVRLFKISSLAALIAVGGAPVFAFLFYGVYPAALVLSMAVLIIVRHKDNIKRLVNGEESKIGTKKKAAGT